MSDSFIHIAFIGPGGPEFIVIMLVLLLMFGAKDAPRIFRKINEALNQIRNTADSFKREIMYSDLEQSPTDSTADELTDADTYYDDDYDYGHAEHEDPYLQDELEQDYSDETFAGLERDIAEAVNKNLAEDDVTEVSGTEESDDKKT